MEARFAAMYSHTGRPGIAPERLLRALLLQMLYGYRSERRRMQERQYNFALRWFVGLGLSEQSWDVTVFTKNRERILKHDLAQEWLQAVVEEARAANLLDEEHFSVDGTLIQAWASEKSYQPKDDPPAPGQGSGRNGRLQRRDIYGSNTDADARLYRKSRREPYRLSYLGHLVTENGHGLIVASAATHASATGERAAAKTMLEKVKHRWANARRRITVGADKAYHQQDFVEAARQLRMEPHIGAYRTRTDLIGEAVRRTRRYRASMARRKWIERCFAWIKGPAGLRQTKFRGLDRVAWNFTFAAGAYNLLRMTRLQATPA